MNFVDLTLADIIEEWPDRAEHFQDIARMMEGRFEVGDLLAYIRDGRFDAHGLRGEDGAAPLTVLTSTVDYPRKRVLCLNAVAGRGIKDWLDIAREGVFNLARRRGAALIEARGRKGWMKLIPGSSAKGKFYLEAEVT